MSETKLYQLIYDTVRQIPYGKVASYGQISAIVSRCSAQMIGFALAALPNAPAAAEVPWQRVVNGQGHISPHGFGVGSGLQRSLLEAEGVEFSLDGSINFEKYGWLGAPPQYRKTHRHEL
jgi:methylated-DNA-protein-cysteine methyltransferase-like protein